MSAVSQIQIPKPLLNTLSRGPTPIVANRNLHGRPFLHDNFNSPELQWFASPTGKATVSRSFDRAYEGKASMHIHVPDNSSNTTIYRGFRQTADIISLECFFTFNYLMRTAVDGQAIFFELYYYTGTRQRLFRTEYRPHFNEWVFWDDNPTSTGTP